MNYAVVHQLNFIDTIDVDAHTQNVDNMQMHAKFKLKRQFDRSYDLFPVYLQEFML